MHLAPLLKYVMNYDFGSFDHVLSSDGLAGGAGISSRPLVVAMPGIAVTVRPLSRARRRATVAVSFFWAVRLSSSVVVYGLHIQLGAMAVLY